MHPLKPSIYFVLYSNSPSQISQLYSKHFRLFWNGLCIVESHSTRALNHRRARKEVESKVLGHFIPGQISFVLRDGSFGKIVLKNLQVNFKGIVSRWHWIVHRRWRAFLVRSFCVLYICLYSMFVLLMHWMGLKFFPIVSRCTYIHQSEVMFHLFKLHSCTIVQVSSITR